MPDIGLKNLGRRRFIATVGAAGGVMTIGAVLPRPVLGQSAPLTVPIGQLVPFTGSAAEFGNFYRDAALLAVEQVKAVADKGYSHGKELQACLEAGIEPYVARPATSANAICRCTGTVGIRAARCNKSPTNCRGPDKLIHRPCMTLLPLGGLGPEYGLTASGNANETGGRRRPETRWWRHHTRRHHVRGYRARGHRARRVARGMHRLRP